LFRRETVADLLAQHEQHQFDHAYRLWALLILELWFQQWCDSPI
jgi:asparagine synthase (glutamine-hydrolysing)